MKASELTGPVTSSERIIAAINIASEYGSADGAHHKAWVIDQMVQTLTGDQYESWVAAVKGRGRAGVSDCK